MTKITKTVAGVRIRPFGPRDSRTGTSLMGYVNTTGNELKRLFGTPTRNRNEKVRVEFRTVLNGEVVRFYDYKEPRAPKMAEVFEWHIGGATSDVVDMVRRIFPVNGVRERR